MKQIFLTHESIRTTPVAKAMLWDVADQFSESNEVIVFSGDEAPLPHPKIQHIVFSADRHSGKMKRGAKFAFGWTWLWKYLFSDVQIYCRSYPVMLVFGLIFSIARKQVIFDTRGLFFHELLESGYTTNAFLVRMLLSLETILLKAATKVICVSEAQMEYYQRRHLKDNKYFVVYNGAPTTGAELQDGRAEGVISFLYLGSLVKWHSIERVRGICDCLSQRRNIRLTIITRSIEEALETFAGSTYPVEVFEHDFRTRPIKYDYGFCLISGGLSKTVCCPVKLAEYLSCGTKVIGSNNVQIHNDYIDRENGILIDLQKTDQDIADTILSGISENPGDASIPQSFTFEHQASKIKEIVAHG